MSVDLVVCLHVIEHLSDPILAITEIRRILKPGGWAIISTPDFDSPCAKRFGDNYRMLHDRTHCSLFTLESMHRFIRDHGLEIRDLKFPFPERYATLGTFSRWADTSKMSPPWPGNWMTFYCVR
jgi:SAM-dependent methyltransferase